MKNKILAIAFMLLPLMGYAEVQYGSEQYSLGMNIGYAHNRTYGSYANIDLGAFMPINKNFEMEAALRYQTAGNMFMGLQLRPKFAVPVGEFYLSNHLQARVFARDKVNEAILDLGVGYRMDYVLVQLGMSTRLIIPQPYNWHGNDQIICEPFNLTYRVQAWVRPQESVWNIWFAVSNYDNYQIERVWVPMFYIGGEYKIDAHWQVNLQASCKPAGMFHLDASYYGADVRAGFNYRF